MPVSASISILWHDDELKGPREGYVAIWRRWFERKVSEQTVTAKFTSTLLELAQILENEDPPFDLIVLDVMLAREQELNFAALGFHREQLLRLDAGAQIAGLMRNECFARGRTKALTRHKDAFIVLLSSTPTVSDLLKNYVDRDKHDRVKAIIKSQSNGHVAVEFDKEMNDLIDSLRPQRTGARS